MKEALALTSVTPIGDSGGIGIRPVESVHLDPVTILTIRAIETIQSNELGQRARPR